MKSISEQIEEVKNEICDTRCKWPNQIPEGRDEDWLLEDPDSPCMNCPLNRL